jgi:hypothetical protein
MVTEKSNIPIVDRQGNEQHIEMVSLQLDKYSIGSRKMSVQFKVGSQWFDVDTEVYRIDHPDLGCYIPSKVLPIGGKLHLMYYTNPDLPNAIRPFEDGMCYAWTLHWTPTTTYRYPALSRVFIDQIVMGDSVVSLFIAGSSTYEGLLSVPEPTKKLPDDLIVYKQSHRWT